MTMKNEIKMFISLTMVNGFYIIMINRFGKLYLILLYIFYSCKQINSYERII